MTERMKEIKEMAKTYSFDELEKMLDNSMIPGSRQDKSLEILFAMVFRKLDDMESKIKVVNVVNDSERSEDLTSSEQYAKMQND